MNKSHLINSEVIDFEHKDGELVLTATVNSIYDSVDTHK